MPNYKFAAFSDTHLPILNRKSWEKTAAVIDAHEPDVIVHLGDLLEGKRGSRHVQDERHGWDAVAEIEAARKFIEEMNERFPYAHKVWLWGNHDANFLTYVPGHQTKEDARTHRALFDSVCGPLLKSWRVIDRYNTDTSWYLGQVCFRHGYSTSPAGIRKEIIQHVPQYGLLVMGHTHRPQAVTQLEWGGTITPWWHCNTGHHAREDDMHYMNRMDRGNWGSGVLIGEARAQGLKEGRRFAATPQWSAELVIHGRNSIHHHDVGFR